MRLRAVLEPGKDIKYNYIIRNQNARTLHAACGRIYVYCRVQWIHTPMYAQPIVFLASLFKTFLTCTWTGEAAGRAMPADTYCQLNA